MRRVIAAIAAAPLIIAVPVAISGASQPPIAGAAGAENYATWTFQDTKQTGTVKLNLRAGGGPITGIIAPVRSDVTTQSGSATWLPAESPFGLVYGPSRSKKFLSVGVDGDDEGRITYTFDEPVPAYSWGIAFGDVESEQITLRAFGPNGETLDVTDWYSGVFNYCSDAFQETSLTDKPDNTGKPSVCGDADGDDVPVWSAAEATLTGTATDTRGATGWFQPTVDVKVLEVELSAITGSPRYQTWMAALPGYTPPDPDPTPSPTPSPTSSPTTSPTPTPTTSPSPTPTTSPTSSPSPGPDPDPADMPFSVTVVARVCPTYDDIMANTKRNNLMQSLDDVGVDSIYPGLGNPPVQPSVENRVATGQAACQPLTGWTFGFGKNFAGTDTGVYGSLGKVADLNGTATTQTSTPELDDLGNPTGRFIDGAATMQLNETQLAIVTGSGNLTAQGGIPGAPLNGTDNRAFGILRCATDDKNGDNVEYVDFPAGAKHVYCYAYYVDTTPEAGTITVKKDVSGSAGGVKFGFGGNVSYNPGGTFSLAAGRSETFERQAGQSWTVTELGADGYQLDGIDCTGGANISADVAAATAIIDLGPGEDVVCVFTNSPDIDPVTTPTIAVYSVSENGTGSFEGSLAAPSGVVQPWNTVTVADNTPVLATEQEISSPGTYTLTQGDQSNWTTSMACTDSSGSVIASASGTSLDVPVDGTSSIHCTITNVRQANGGITITATIVGGNGEVQATSYYRLEAADGTLRPHSTDDGSIGEGDVNQTIEIVDTAWNQAVSASFGTALPNGEYTVTGIPPADTQSGSWSLSSATCSGDSTVTGAMATITLSEAQPSVTCDVVYALQSLNPTLTVIKSVSSGEAFRSGPAVIAVTCETDSTPYSTLVTLPPGVATTTQVVVLPSDATSCVAQEISTGARPAVDPGEISVTYDGEPWPAGETRDLPNGISAAVVGASSTGATVTESVVGDCVQAGTNITPTRRGSTCDITFTASGGFISTETRWATAMGSGVGLVAEPIEISPGLNYQVAFTNSYSGQTTTSSAIRRIDTTSSPGILDVAALIPVGNDLREDPVTVRVTCAVSALLNPSAWPQTVTVAPDRSAAERSLIVPGNRSNADVCQVLEVSSGIVNPARGKITPTWNTKYWKSTVRKRLTVGTSAVVSATATSGSDVSIVEDGPCSIVNDRVTADTADATCLITFRAQDLPKVVSTTTYLRGEYVVTSATQERRVLVANRYREDARTITAERTVETVGIPQCPLDVSSAAKVKPYGTTMIIKGAVTGAGCVIAKVQVTCRPADGAILRGDFDYCIVTRASGSRVYVTPTSNRDLVVEARVEARGEGRATTAWERTYRVNYER